MGRGVITVTAAAGLGVYFTRVGLDNADKLASVIGAFIGLAGLALTARGLLADRRAAPAASQAAGGQQVSGSEVGGDVLQVKGVTGNLRIGGQPRPPAPSPTHLRTTPTAPSSAARSRDEEQGQSVRDSHVAGDVTQVDQVGGDTDIDR
jgi:hypothetical protein